MSTTIGSLSSTSWVSKLFTKIDTKNQGYIDKSELQTALGQLSASDSTTTVDKIFSKLDADNDGKITKQEMSDSMQKLAQELDNQFNQMRVNGQGGKDTGFSKDELTSMIADIGDTDSKRTALMQSIVDNFDKADTNGDGKVTNSEAMAYDQTINGTSSTTAATGSMPPPPPPPPSGTSSSDGSSSSTSGDSATTYAAADTNKDGIVSLEELLAYEGTRSTDTTSSSDAMTVMKTMMQLMQAYGLSSSGSAQVAASSSISAIA